MPLTHVLPAAPLALITGLVALYLVWRIAARSVRSTLFREDDRGRPE